MCVDTSSEDIYLVWMGNQTKYLKKLAIISFFVTIKKERPKI